MNNAPEQLRTTLLLNPSDAAAALSICERSLWAVTAPRGSLRCVRIGRSVRYDLNDLREWLDNMKQEPAER